MVSSCYEEELNRFNVEEGGEEKKTPRTNSKGGKGGTLGFGDVYLLGNSQHSEGKGELVFGLWGFLVFWCHSR